MRVLVIGAAGMVGQQLLQRIEADPSALGSEVTELMLVDVAAPKVPPGLAGIAKVTTVDLSDPGQAAALIQTRPDLIVHLAAIVSGEAESDYEKGYRINLDGSRALLDAIVAQEHYCPKLLFASSIAVFGAPFPDAIGDDFMTTPLTSYGTQKAITELLISDLSRRGFLDGISLRLPTICVRPGQANLAASSFFSGIIREPLAGQEAVLPVDEDVMHWFASPRAAGGFFVHAARMDLSALGDRRALTMPGLAATVGEQIAALGRVAGPDVVKLIRKAPDPVVAQIVGGWPRRFDAARAASLGFVAETTFDDIIRVYLEEHGDAVSL